MDAAQYATIATRLSVAVTQAGLVLERGTSQQGQLVYRPVAATELLGRLMQLGYRISLAAPTEERSLRLVHPEVEDDDNR